jgi:hypothetical protein
MSKQFRVYLLPSDAKRLLEELRGRNSFRCLSDRSATMEPVDLASPLRQSEDHRVTSVRCFLAQPSDGKVRLEHYPTLSAWLVQIESEVIEFSGCDFNGDTLRVGRFYFQTDFLAGQEILPKRPEFIAWADKIFRYAKRSLHRSAELDAYVGSDAEEFRNTGGTFKQF